MEEALTFMRLAAEELSVADYLAMQAALDATRKFERGVTPELLRALIDWIQQLLTPYVDSRAMLMDKLKPFCRWWCLYADTIVHAFMRDGSPSPAEYEVTRQWAPVRSCQPPLEEQEMLHALVSLKTHTITHDDVNYLQYGCW